MKLFRILLLTIFVYTLISCGGAEERKAVYLEKAKSSMEVGELEKARIELKNVLQIDPKDGMACYYLGKIFEQQKKYRKAYRQYLKAEELSPELLENHASLGRFYLLLMNDSDKAQEKVDLILSNDADNSDGLLLKAAVAVKNKNTEEAIKIADDILTREPEHIESVIFLALLHMNAKKYSVAIDVLDSAITDKKNNEELNKLLGSALMLNKDYERAELIYKDFLKRNPDVSSSYENLAAFYTETGDIAKAEEILRASINNDPDDIDRQLALVIYIRAKKSNDEAIKVLEGFVAKHSGSGKLRLSLAELQIFNKDKQSAIETYQKAINDFSQEVTGVSARTALASLYISDKNYDKAAEIVEEALSISHNDPSVNFLSAKFAIRDKDLEKAVISLRIVTKEMPENIEAFILLAKIYQSEGSDDKVKSTLNSAYDSNRSNADALLALSRYYLSQDIINQAEKIIDDYNSLREDDYEGLSIKAAILNKRKVQGEAFKLAEKLMESYPDKPNGYLLAAPYFGQQGDIQQAISILEKGYINAKDNRKILLALTTVQVSEKLFDLAINRITTELKASSDDDELKILLAKVYVAKKDIDSAATLLLDVVDGKSVLEEPYLLLAKVYQNKKDLNASKSILIKGKDNVVSSIKIPLGLASIYEHENEYKKAINVYRVLYEVHSENQLIINNLASMLSDYGNGKSDLELAKALALKLEKSGQPVFLDTIGWVYYKSGDFEKAVQYLTMSVEKVPNVNVFNYHLGMAYQAKGDKVNAKIYLEKSLADGKAFKEKEMAEKALGEL